MTNVPTFPCDVNKRPLTPNGFKDATTDDWTASYPHAAMTGMPTGATSGLFVLDLDVNKQTGEQIGEANLAALGITIPDGTPCVRTPSGGLHYYFLHHPGLKSTANKIASKIDTRADGGYVIVPPSNGYTWITSGVPTAIPADLMRVLPRSDMSGPTGVAAPAVAPDRAAVSPMDLDLLVTVERADNKLELRDDWFAVINAVKFSVITAQPAAQAVFRQALIDWSCRWPDSDEHAAAEAARAWDTARPDGRVKAGTAMRLLRPMLPKVMIDRGPDETTVARYGEYLTTFDQIEFFKGCVYITEDHAVLMLNGEMLKPEQFSIRMGGYEFQMSSDGTRPTRNAWEAFTQNRAFSFPKVRGKCFSPKTPFGTIIDGRVNVFKRESIITSDEPVDRFLELLGLMLPVESDRKILLSWIAAMVQNPGHKFQWSIVIQGAEGNGKTFLMRCIEYAVGREVTHLPNPEDMDEKYNTYLEQKLLIGVEEVHVRGRYELMDRLKKYITNDRIEVRGMGTDKRMTDNLTNWIFFTNFKDAVIKTEGDRRYAILYTAQQSAADVSRDMGGQFFPGLWDWARAGGFAAIAGYLTSYEIDAANDPLGACHRAPVTSATREAIGESLGAVEQEIREAIDAELAGFCGGWLSSARVREMLRKSNFRLSNHAIRNAISALGYTPCDLWAKGRSPKLMIEGNQRVVLYCTEDVQKTARNVEDYLHAQGYLIPTTLP
jgi:hypothetical protein